MDSKDVSRPSMAEEEEEIPPGQAHGGVHPARYRKRRERKDDKQVSKKPKIPTQKRKHFT